MISVTKTNMKQKEIYNLLLKYIKYVDEVEGVDFILTNDLRHISDVKFTEKEWAALVSLAKK